MGGHFTATATLTADFEKTRYVVRDPAGEISGSIHDVHARRLGDSRSKCFPAEDDVTALQLADDASDFTAMTPYGPIAA